MANKLFENTVCLAVTFHRIGCNRRLKRGEARVVNDLPPLDNSFDESSSPDQSKFSVAKKIFASDHYKKAARINHDFDAWMSKRSVPSPLRRGTYLVPIKMLDEVYERLDRDQAEYKAEAELLIAEYDELKRAAKESLKQFFREEDYPSVEYIRRMFWVERRMFDFSPPGEAKLSEAVYEQERDRWSKLFAEAENDVRLALRESMRDLVAHLSDRLASNDDGNKKRLHASAVDKIVEFLELFDRRNVLQDDELKKLVDKAKRVVSNDGFLVEALREDASIRAVVREQMDRVKTKLDALIESGPRRVVTFEED